MAWPVSSMPLFCQNTKRQIDNILNSLQTIRRTVDGTNGAGIKLPKPGLFTTEQVCGLAQKLTDYQACELDLSTDIKLKVNYTKVETKGLADNVQMNAKICVLSPPSCPTNPNLSLWSKAQALLDSWYQDVAEISNALQSMCPNITGNSLQL